MAIQKVYSIGFTQRRAEDFFGTLKNAEIRRLIDVRLNNVSQLAGFTKREDLPYFLEKICAIEYLHETLLAPTQELLDLYKKRHCSWIEYELLFVDLMRQRQIEAVLPRETFFTPTVLLCSEPDAEHCHRRLVLEYLQQNWGELEIIHL
ncbi:MAG: DUF488 domain-containing protein [Chloroflexi bacterium]|nr:DUF488 domain-containing protein [Chloroflexota bacterium]